MKEKIENLSNEIEKLLNEIYRISDPLEKLQKALDSCVNRENFLDDAESLKNEAIEVLQEYTK